MSYSDVFITKLITIIESNGDKINSDFNIYVDSNGQYTFAVSGAQLDRFLADVYGKKSFDDLKYAQKTATAADVINYLGSELRFNLLEKLNFFFFGFKICFLD